jgi:hypothetical protein
MITEIGLIAGDIWHYLEKRGPSKLEDIASGKLKKIGHLRRFDELQNFVEPVNNLIESINKRLALDAFQQLGLLVW